VDTPCSIVNGWSFASFASCMTDRWKTIDTSSAQRRTEPDRPYGRPPVHDHIVFGKNGHASMKGLRLM